MEQSIIIRELNVKDIPKLHRMYDNLSLESKCFFHPGFLGFDSINFKWIILNVALFLASFKVVRSILLKMAPLTVFFSLIAIHKSGVIVGFSYLKIKKLLRIKGSKCYSAILGIVISESYRGKGLGTLLMNELLRLARKNKIYKVVLNVNVDNIKAIRLYEKYGFRKVGIATVCWRGKKIKSIIMEMSILST